MNRLRISLLIGWMLIGWTTMLSGNTNESLEGIVGEVRPISCIQELQVSIGPNGYEVLTPQLILADVYADYSPFVVTIQGLGADTVYCDQVNSTVMVTVTNTISGNSCWSNVSIEDKLDPIITCINDTFPCYIHQDSVDYSVYATATDNCDTDVKLYYAYKLNTFFCDPDYTKRVTLEWTAEDDNGNTATCTSIVMFEKLDIADAVFPGDTTLYCPYPDTALVGVPTIDGLPISVLCELVSFYRDDTTEICSGSFMIEREWSVMDWCNNLTITDIQNILFQDTLPPILDCSIPDTIGTDYDMCSATYIVPPITATDLCGSDDSLMIDSVFFADVPGLRIGDTIVLDTGCHNFVYYATDHCGNVDSCFVKITVVDDDPPTLICEAEITVYLDSLGQAELCIEDFDHINHYFDNCGIDSLFLAKMEDNCDTSLSGKFDFCIQFCCAEACEPGLMVIVKAQDLAGNMNFCMIAVNVLDTTAPVITSSPPDTTISCLVDYRDTSMTGGGITFTDMCDSVAVLTIEDTVNIDACLEGTVERYFIITDKCGNSDTAFQLITIVNSFVFDSAAIIWPEDVCIEDCPVDSLPETIGSFPIIPGDTCGVVMVSYTDNDISDPDDACLVIERTWTVRNECRDTFEMDSVQIVTIKNYRAPILSGPPLDTTISTGPDSCSATVTLPTLVATDCSTGLIVTNDCTAGGAVVMGTFPAGVKTITYTATDACGNVSTYQTILRIVDNAAPTIVCPSDTTINCNTSTDTAVLGTPVVFDNCEVERGIDVSFMDNIIRGACPSEFTIERVWKVEDGEGNEDSCTQTIIVQDTMAPVLTCPNDTLINCDAPMDTAALGVAVGVDNCQPNVTITFIDTRIDGNCLFNYTIEREWTAMDSCGNSRTCTQNIEVQDTVAPVINCPPDITVECSDQTDPMTTGNPVIMDNCDPMPNSVFMDSIVMGMGQTFRTIYRTWTVTDVCGNDSTCEQIITVRDTEAPMITCPSDTTVDCDVDLSDLSDFGSPFATDNCSGEVITSDTIYDITVCSVGTITRVFFATDSVGNQSSCEQIITIELRDSLDDSEIIWPDTLVTVDACLGIDPDSIFIGRPTVDSTSASCFLLSSTYIDSVDYSCGGGVCSTVTRAWIVIDSCTYDSTMGTGIFTFTQTIEVVDTTLPEILCVQSDTFYIHPDSMTCDVFIPLLAKAEDCSGIKYLRNNSQYGRDTFADASGRYPKGGHVVTFITEDSCCNINALPIILLVLDTIPPSVTCRDIEKRIAGEGEMAMAEVCVSELVAMISDNCDTVDDIEVTFDPMDLTDTCRVYNCDSLMGMPFIIRSLTLYIIDGSGNIVTCVARITITDPNGICAGMIVQGEVENIRGEGIENAEMGVQFSTVSEMTDNNGHYAFAELDQGGAYRIKGQKVDDAINGVSTRDLLYIQRHLLGHDEFQTAEEYLAADVNGNSSVEVRDLVLLRRLLLGMDNDLPEVPDWYFVSADHVFRDITKPLEEYEAFFYFIPGLSSSMDLGFTGVKPGDLDGSAKVNGLSGINSRDDDEIKLVLDVPERMTAGKHMSATLHFGGTVIPHGIQMILEYNPQVVEVHRLHSYDLELAEASYVIDRIRGEIRVVWFDALNSLSSDEINLSIDFTPIVGVDENTTWLSVNAELLPALLFDETDEDYRIILEAQSSAQKEISSELVVAQNVPNPFEIETTIEFSTPIEEIVEINVLNASGQIIYRNRISAQKGWNQVLIGKEEIGHAGLYYYQIESSIGTKTMKMIIVE